MISDSDAVPEAAEPWKGHEGEAVTQASPLLTAVRVKVVLAVAPFPTLAVYVLPQSPRPGDIILVDVNGVRESAKVEWVNFQPHDVQAIVQIGVAFIRAQPTQATGPHQSPPDLEKQVEKIIEMNARVFEKATAYSNVMMLAGYAGIFAIWSFVKQDLSNKAADTVAVMLGLSLLIYVTFELYGMFIRAAPMAEVAKHTGDKPPNFHEAVREIETRQNRRTLASAIVWRLAFWPTVLLGYASALLLFYNLLAVLLSWPKWPT